MTNSQPNELNVADVLALLAKGDLDVQGMLPWSSNYTLLTTVLWDYAGRPLARDMLADLRALREEFDAKDAAFAMLESLLAPDEMRVLRRRLDRLVSTGKHPDPGPGRNIPWPPV